ncbi:insulin-like growth factor-binding protein 3 [Clupea harengus]|uniref:Insulin-like growth factor-binding protein 3 n=1 Tax=Clupea harengus TaxID=7950 RepID=A0A6P8ESQ5_CLUHA|nr:insulin-like growth factor-binding protein 3 [Clupea harengus]
MVSRLYSLFVTVVLASVARFTGAVGPVIRCEPCDAGSRMLCKPIPKDCAEKVREPGCGCCLTCALAHGQPCGIYTGRCGFGLTCQHQPGETKPLQALLEGRGICANATSKKLLRTQASVKENEGTEKVPGEEPSSNSNTSVHQGSASPPPPAGVPRLPSQHHPLYHSHAKAEVIRREHAKKSQSFKMEGLPIMPNTDQQNFSLETKPEPEFGPCRREMESILNSLKVTDILNPKGFRIPNCDKKGFYKKRQCRPSNGRKRGFCWCVDKYGQPLPGYKGKEKGDAHCYNLDNQ